MCNAVRFTAFFAKIICKFFFFNDQLAAQPNYLNKI